MNIDFYVLVPIVSDALFEALGILTCVEEVSFDSGWLEEATLHDMQRLVAEKGQVSGYFGPRRIYVSIFEDGRAVIGDCTQATEDWGDSPSCREDAIRWQKEFLGFMGKMFKFFSSHEVSAVAFYETPPPLNVAEFEAWLSEPWLAVFDEGEFRFAVPPNVLK